MNFIKALRIKFTLVVLTSFSPIGELRLGATANSDWLVLGIQHNAFTASDRLFYLVSKSCLKNSGSAKNLSHTTPLSTTRKSEFRLDMLIHQEAQKLGSYEPTKAMLSQALEIAKPCEGVFTKLLSYFSRGKGIIASSVTRALRVESYRRAKVRQSEILSAREKRRAMFSNHFEKWKADLERKYTVQEFSPPNPKQ